MNFEPSPFSAEMLGKVDAFLREHVEPLAERPADIEPLKEKARAAGLWNLFLPGLREDEPGTRMSNLDYAPLAERMGRVYWSSEVFNCSAPDTGNMELLHLFATKEQRERWLLPLLRGEIRSCFAMTEPDVASSDPTNLRTTIRRDGGGWVISGRKWFTSGAADPRCKVAIVMGVTSPDAKPHHRMGMVVVPMDAPGVKVIRNVPIMSHESPEGHCEVVFEDVRVPLEAIIGAPGEGFRMAQARLGPGRVHHCMRSIGQCELALELMRERAASRVAFGKRLADHGQVAEWIALSRIEIEQGRLLTLKAAWLMDRHGNEAARREVAMIKVVVPRIQTAIADRAIQVFGAKGLTNDTPLAFLWTWGRALRIVDGPDEVHLRTIVKAEVGE